MFMLKFSSLSLLYVCMVVKKQPHSLEFDYMLTLSLVTQKVPVLAQFVSIRY